MSATTQEVLDAAWAEVVHQKANCDAALAVGDWANAGHYAHHLRWAASELEDAITAHGKTQEAKP